MKNFLVVGASSGIGKSLATTLSDSGAFVQGTYCDNPVESSTPNTDFYPLDVRQTALDLDFVSEPLDGLVYCPGSINLRPFSRIKPEEFMADLDLQVIGAVRVIQGVLPKLKLAVNASIVLFSTVAVQKGFSFHTQVSVSKGAIEGLTKSLAAELSPAIRVNCIAPSLTDTPLASRLINTEEKKSANAERHPLKRIGKPEDIAEMAAFLLSEKASWITGQTIGVDGGISTINV